MIDTARFMTALQENNNNITETAKLLGITRWKARQIAASVKVVPNSSKVNLKVRSLDRASPRQKEIQAVVAKFPELMAQHKSMRAVSLATGIARSVLKRHLKWAGIAVEEAPKPPKSGSEDVRSNKMRIKQIEETLPQILPQYKTLIEAAKALNVDKKTFSRMLKRNNLTFARPEQKPQVETKPVKPRVADPTRSASYYSFGHKSAPAEQRIMVEYCADPKLEKARAMLLKGEDEWEVHQRAGVPLRDVYRLRYENRERAKGRM